MLTVFSGCGGRDCEGALRRDFLRAGALSLGSLALPDLLAAQSATDAPFVNDKSVVLLYLSGGASHIETFDPKMDAPDGARSATGACQTSLPGVAFGGTFPELAKRADKLAVVRSFAHKVGSHEQAHVHVLSGGTDPQGRQDSGFSMGSCFARLRGANHPATGMPTYALLTEKEIDGQYRKEYGRINKGSWPGSLGSSFAPLNHQVGWDENESPKQADRSKQKNANPLAANMNLNMPVDVLEDRMELLRSINRLRSNIEADGAFASLDDFRSQAISLIMGGAAEAFDYRREDPRLIERYDTSQIRIGHKVFRPSTLGKQMLVARRLCEAGCGFVTVHSAGWDMHADKNNPGIIKGMEMLGRSLDQAVAAFLDDLAERGLSEKIMLVITGDFGRTPRINKNGGRDHWAKLGTLAFAGGGLRMGQVVGQSARKADAPASDPISTTDLMATILNTLFDIGKLRVQSGLPRKLKTLIENGQPIEQLF